MPGDQAGNKGPRQPVLAAQPLLCVGGGGTEDMEDKCPGRRSHLTSSLPIVATCKQRPRIARASGLSGELEILIFHI